MVNTWDVYVSQNGSVKIIAVYMFRVSLVNARPTAFSRSEASMYMG